MSPHKRHRQYGFNLIELMVAMVVGSIIILGIVNLFGSNQQTQRIKEQIDQAHETFRFTSYTLMKIVRSASSFAVNEAGDEITFTFDGNGEQMNCIGQAAAAGETNRLYLEGDVLMCDTGSSNLRLATGISSITFNEYVQNVTDAIVNSVRTSITMNSGRDLSFVSTVRSIAITQ
jgi:prepilin-type N-terminal cleavage/methylation domain-containing protein